MIHHGSTTNHHGTPRYTTILQIMANRSGTVAKNRECVNGPLDHTYTLSSPKYWLLPGNGLLHSNIEVLDWDVKPYPAELKVSLPWIIISLMQNRLHILDYF